MEITIIVLTIALIRVFIAAVIPRFRSNATLLSEVKVSLCISCRHAHIARGYREGQERIFCAYVYPAQRVKYAIRDCTSYCNRNAELRKNAGFVLIDGACNN